MVRYSEENERLADKSRCAGVRADLKLCLLESDCCKIHKRTPRECLLTGDETVPYECHILRNTFFECKRSIVDGRRRFRGPRGY
ncbi:cytochrome c oxidase assembly factor 5 [Orussus abietinus]|uniref:cytochrome c oxidase assembly factor 5 n=1 Tax=Orussus abietinus TaxID=222816 RepID=UPI000625032A|nr:cytochrome c oxidase assembly factor 5 [Orussus abietinus]XP_012273300.1 cytochrome c oxidase assembly factor 5 [Orussus abietinus]XP_012273302.1 cytochrome c oxidase assembly factor 5 [Orussus abietinus]